MQQFVNSEKEEEKPFAKNWRCVNRVRQRCIIVEQKLFPVISARFLNDRIR